MNRGLSAVELQTVTRVIGRIADDLNTLNFHHLDQCENVPETLVNVLVSLDALHDSLNERIPLEDKYPQRFRQ